MVATGSHNDLPEITVIPAFTSHTFNPIMPSKRVVAEFTGGDIPVVGYLLTRDFDEGDEDDDEDPKLTPIWVAAIIDPDSGRVYNPAGDANFVQIRVENVPEEHTVIP